MPTGFLETRVGVIGSRRMNQEPFSRTQGGVKAVLGAEAKKALMNAPLREPDFRRIAGSGRSGGLASASSASLFGSQFNLQMEVHGLSDSCQHR